MSNYDPSELIALCESIVEDGEISGDELYRLAEWLNGHREACCHWPGDLLVGPLQDLWADGKATTTEMRKMGRLLARIQKEVALDTASEFVFENAPRFDLSRPQLPAIPFATRVKSSTDKNVFYDVDLTGPTCSCPDWNIYRRNLPQGHLTRCCKHVLAAHGKLDYEDGWSGWLGAFIGCGGYPPHPKQEWLTLQINGVWVLASTAPTGWASVFAPGDEAPFEFDRFGYNVPENRWSYGMKPMGAKQIASRISRATVAAPQNQPPVITPSLPPPFLAP